jgi:glycine cleavage system aminomethyltransferase T
VTADRPLSPLKVLDLAARMLEAHGFAIVARNERGDSLYLRRPDCAWHLRVSNHARTAKQRARRSDVLASLVIDGPRSPDQIGKLVRDAVRNFEAARARVADQASAAGSRK